MVTIDEIAYSKANVKTFIFDLDGVIVTTDELHFQAWKRAVQEHFGIEIDNHVKNIVRGNSRIESLRLLLSEYSIDNVSQDKLFNTLKTKHEVYNEIISNATSENVIQGAEDVLKFLREKEAIVILASSSINAVKVLEKLNLIKYFDNVVDVSTIDNPKPDPEIFIKASQIACETPRKCTVIEDSQVGINGAKAAGMFVISFNQENQHLENFDLEVKTHNELLELLKQYYSK